MVDEGPDLAQPAIAVGVHFGIGIPRIEAKGAADVSQTLQEEFPLAVADREGVAHCVFSCHEAAGAASELILTAEC